MIAVTGGAGFIGSSLVWGLNSRGIKDILIIDDLEDMSPLKKANLKNLHFSQLIGKKEYIENPGSFASRGKDVIFHIGACSSTTETDRDYLKRNNFEYTKKLARYALDHGKRFIYASSAATYGDGSAGFDDAEDKLDIYKPLNPYGESKHMFDLWARSEGILDRIAGLKYFNVYGPNEYHKGDMMSFVVKAFRQVKESGCVRLFKSYRGGYADGEQMRDFVYIKDAVSVTLHFFDNPDINGIYNVGTGKSRNWNDLVKAVFTAMEIDPDIEYIPMPDNIREQYQYYTCASLDKLEASGYKGGFRSLESGIDDYVCNYLVSGTHLTSK